MNASHHQSEDRLARLLAATEHDAAPIDRDALAAIRERSLAELAAAGAEPQLTHQQRATMFLSRALIALAALAASVVGAMWLADRPAGAPAVAEVALGTVTLTTSSGTQQVFRGGPDELRIELGQGRYEIARGDTRWIVDEADNRATSSPAPYYSPQLGGIDPLRLVGFDSADFLNARPTQKRREHGREQLVYFCSQPIPGGTRELSVLVDSTPPFQMLELESRLLTSKGTQALAEYKPAALLTGQALPAGQFQVPATLTEDGRIGRVTDHQGLVALRPLTSTRWTPICGPAVFCGRAIGCGPIFKGPTPSRCSSRRRRS
jgi:hypothetical protein